MSAAPTVGLGKKKHLPLALSWRMRSVHHGTKGATDDDSANVLAFAERCRRVCVWNCLLLGKPGQSMGDSFPATTGHVHSQAERMLGTSVVCASQATVASSSRSRHASVSRQHVTLHPHDQSAWEAKTGSHDSTFPTHPDHVSLPPRTHSRRRHPRRVQRRENMLHRHGTPLLRVAAARLATF